MHRLTGFCIFTNWSCRDIQCDESAVALRPAKGKADAASLDPWLVTTGEMPPLPLRAEGKLIPQGLMTGRNGV